MGVLMFHGWLYFQMATIINFTHCCLYAYKPAHLRTFTWIEEPNADVYAAFKQQMCLPAEERTELPFVYRKHTVELDEEFVDCGRCSVQVKKSM